MTPRRFLPGLLLVVAAAACSFQNVQCGLPSSPPDEPVPAEVADRGLPAGAEVVGIGFLGDSLTAGFGLLTEEAYPALIQQLFLDEGYPEVTVINAGASGDTTAGGLRRIETLFEPHVRIIVVALGGNDALRGLTLTQTRENLAAIIDKALSAGRDVLVAGMQAPTNLGPDYQEGFREIFLSLAGRYRGRIEMVPFLLEGVAGDPALNQPDGIHPNAQGARVIADLLYPRLRVLVDLNLGGGGGA